jgi:hypothetical protein
MSLSLKTLHFYQNLDTLACKSLYITPDSRKATTSCAVKLREHFIRMFAESRRKPADCGGRLVESQGRSDGHRAAVVLNFFEQAPCIHLRVG